MKALYALFPDPDSAQRGFHALKSASAKLGFDAGKIVVASSEPFEGYEFAEAHGKSPMFWMAALGGLVGGIFGYWLTTFTQHAYPLPTGGMPLSPPWTNGIIVYELTMLGAILFTLGTLLLSARLPNFRPQVSDPRIWDGNILVGVCDPPANIHVELENLLRHAGAVDVTLPI